jgi:hypothetical protein
MQITNLVNLSAENEVSFSRRPLSEIKQLKVIKKSIGFLGWIFQIMAFC